VFANADKAPDDVVFTRKVDGRWAPVTAKEFATEVAALAAGLGASGVQAGERVGLMSKTRYEWTLCDYAIWTAGAVTVPIYETSSAEQVQWNLGRLRRRRGHRRERLPRGGVPDDREPAPRRQRRLADRRRRPRGARRLRSRRPDSELEARRDTLTADSLATIISHLGTTGRPKGCELTHHNLLGSRARRPETYPQVFHANGSTLLFLPLAHVFARLIQVACVESGARMGHTADIKALLPDFASFKPTFILSVPRVFEKVYNTAKQKAHGDGRARSSTRPRRPPSRTPRPWTAASPGSRSA
jgi:long-chain acyl-CoA synthetase